MPFRKKSTWSLQNSAISLARCREQYPPLSGRSLAAQSQLYAADGKSAAGPTLLSLRLCLHLRRSSLAQANDRKHIAGINDKYDHYIQAETGKAATPNKLRQPVSFLHKETAQNFTIQRCLYGTPPGTRTPGQLIKRNREAFFIQTGTFRKSVVFVKSSSFYPFLSVASFAWLAPLCIQVPALQCAENVQG